MLLKRRYQTKAPHGGHNFWEIKISVMNSGIFGVWTVSALVTVSTHDEEIKPNFDEV